MIRMTIQIIPKHRSLRDRSFLCYMYLSSENNTIGRCRLSLFPYNAMVLSALSYSLVKRDSLYLRETETSSHILRGINQQKKGKTRNLRTNFR